MSCRNLMSRLDRALASLPRCAPGQTREIRSTRRYRDTPYRFTEADRCVLCGELGCGIKIVEEVEVTCGPDGVLVDARGVGVPAL